MYYFIVNPSSRSGMGKKVWMNVQAELEKAEVDYRVYFTHYEYHATELARELTSQEEYLTLVALGGDGTVNEVLNGIQDFKHTTFAYIPTGSSNDFARALKLPSDAAQAVKFLLNPQYFRKMDTGLITFDGQERRFAVSCGMGFDASVCVEALRSPIKKNLNRIGLGKLAYVGIALKQILLFHPAPTTLVLDDSKTISFEETYFMAAMNTCYEGGGLKFCPKANPDDGFIDICVIANLSKLKILCLLSTAFFGWHTRFSGVYTYRCRSAKFLSEQPLPVHTDGEICKHRKEVTVSCISHKLKMVASGKSIM